MGSTSEEPNAPAGEVALEDAGFTYDDPERPALEGIRLRVAAGGLHAVVGPNGSGKTTLLKLIAGLYKPTEGRVLLDGADLRQFTRRQLARWVSYVPQEPALFAGSVRANITMGHGEVDDDRVLEAARTAGIHEALVDMPDGYATEVGENGRRLSRGLQQRVALARALVNDPKVLLLDEPTSSLDRRAEESLRDALVRLSQERTILVVTHSPLLLGICHNILALERGRVRMAGPRSEVLPKLFGSTPRHSVVA